MNTGKVCDRLMSVLLSGAVLRGVAGAATFDESAAYALLQERVGVSQQTFYVYRDADSGLNHGFPSGFFGVPSKVHIDAACLYDAAAPLGCSSDAARLDRDHGTVLRLTIDPLVTGEFAGVNFEEPENWGATRIGAGYDLRGATRVVFEVLSPMPGGAQVQFGVAGRTTPWMTIPQSTTFTTVSLDLAGLGVTDDMLAAANLLFTVVTNDAHAPNGATILLDDVRFEPVPVAAATVPSFPIGTETFGVVPQPVVVPGRVPLPSDQVVRQVTTIYESALALLALDARAEPGDLTAARALADAFDAALQHDNEGDALPASPHGLGLHNAYSSGPLPLHNGQGPGRGQVGEVRLAGFSASTTLCGPSGFCLVLDGATGGNDAFALMGLLAAYQRFGDPSYLDDARLIGHWLVETLADPDPSSYGGYFLGFDDRGVTPKVVLHGKSIENNADIFSALVQLALVEERLGDETAATSWRTAAYVAGDFVMKLFDPVSGCFFAGTVPVGTPPSAGISPGGTAMGNDVVNQAQFLDSNTFVLLPMLAHPRYRDQIDWRAPLRCALSAFAQSVDAAGATYRGFDIVTAPTAGPAGVAWEFTGQMPVAADVVDARYATSEFAAGAASTRDEIAHAQATAPFGDGRGVVAGTMAGGDALAPIDQCLSTPFQCIPERVGLAATTWAIFAARSVNPFDVVPLARCTDSEQAVTPSDVACALDDVRAIVDGPPQPSCVRLCTPQLDRRITRLGDDLARAQAAGGGSQCRKLYGRVAHRTTAFARLVQRLEKRTHVVPAERASRLAAATARLDQRATRLAASAVCGAPLHHRPSR